MRWPKFDGIAYLHLASGSLVSGSVLWLKPCFDFDSLFYFVTFFFFSISHAALHGTWPRTPNYPSFLTQLFHHPPTPTHRTPNPSSPPITDAPDSWADSGLRSTRSMGGAAHTPSKLLLSDLPPGSGQARGLSAGIHPSPDQPTAPTQSLWSQICLIVLNSE